VKILAESWFARYEYGPDFPRVMFWLITMLAIAVFALTTRALIRSSAGLLSATATLMSLTVIWVGYFKLHRLLSDKRAHTILVGTVIAAYVVVLLLLQAR